jgi:hypothetical protein
VGRVGWTSDGGSFLLAARDDSGTTLFRVHPGNSEPERLWHTTLDVRGLAPSPDGHRVAYFIQENEAEIWVVENLVAALKQSEGPPVASRRPTPPRMR